MTRTGLAALACAGCLGLTVSSAAHADRDEAWLHRADLPADLNPLLLLLLDTSATAASPVAAPPAYDASRDYALEIAVADRCDARRVYWRRGPGPAPDCALQAGLTNGGDGPERGFHCDAARAALAGSGFFVASRAAQWHGIRGWRALAESAAGAVECRADRGGHGASPGAWYAAEDGARPWTIDAAREIRWNRPPFSDPYIFYHGNFLNYLRAALPAREIPIVDLARDSLSGALRATDRIDAALMLFAEDADGGFVRRGAAPAAELAAIVERSVPVAPSPGAPLGELLSEAAAWLSGATARFGGVAGADTGAFEGDSTRYRSPYTHACRPVSLAVVTAAEASADEEAADAAAALPGFAQHAGSCGGDCVAALTNYLRSVDLRGSTPGRQSVQPLWIAPAARGRAIAATLGGTSIARIEDPHAYPDLIARAHQYDATVAAGPSLSSAGFLAAAPAAHAPAVLYALAAPRPRERWLGNAFRYGLRTQDAPLLPPLVVDRDQERALDADSGLPLPGSRSLWSDAPDANLLAGGASGRLPEPATRRLFTDIASPQLADSRNRLEPDNPLLVRASLGLGALDPESTEDAIGWLRATPTIGDPGQHPPVAVHFGEQELTIAFVATQDGLLHAFDADTGVERWAWLPLPLLPRLVRLMRDEATAARGHGIDGRLVVHRHDADGDGSIDTGAGEHLWLLFGLGRGGERFFSLDIARPDEPQLLWSQVPSLAGDAGTFPDPVVARLATGDPRQSAGAWIVMQAGGRTLRLLDAATGAVLWAAGDETSDLPLPELEGSFASAPRVADLDGDDHVDRAYAVDTAGGLWRFDFLRDAVPRELGRARRIALLGSGAQRFLSSPDISVAVVRGRREIAIAVGSGRLDRPREAVEVDRVYVVFDRDRGQELTEADLHDATDRASAMAPGAPGWYLRLDRHGPGEKVAGAALTFDHRLRFQTYLPLPARADEPCGPPRAIHRRYARDIRTGLPAWLVEAPTEDMEFEAEADGLPPELRYAFPLPSASDCTSCRPRAFGVAGPRIFDTGYAGDPVRTTWRRMQAPPASP